jgi:molybdopterin-binding protein
MKYGARNQIPAVVTSIKKGPVMGQVSLRVTGTATMGSVMTMDSITDLGIKEGDEVKLIIKAINVLIVKE